MAKAVSDGLSRLQNASRISTSTWRQWCEMLKLEPIDAIDVWEEICHPIMVASRKVPEVPYILQLRKVRPQLDIYEFKEEVPKVLHVVTFLYRLRDENLTTKGKVKSALLKLYGIVAERVGDERHHSVVVQQFIIEACMAILVTKLMKGGQNISLNGVLRAIIEGRGSLEQILSLVLKVVGDTQYADVVKECLDVRYLDPDGPAPPPVGENGQADDEDKNDDDDAPIQRFLVSFKTALRAIYESESAIGGGGGDGGFHEVLDARIKAMESFVPIVVTIPSMEEAQSIACRVEAARNPTKLNKPTLGARPTPKTGGGGATDGGRSGRPTNPGGVKKSSGGSGPLPRPGRLAPRTDGEKEARVDMDKIEGVEVDPTDYADVAVVSFGEFSEKVRQVCAQLAMVEKIDQISWNLFIEPNAAIPDIYAYVRMASRENTETFKAYSILKMASQYISLKNLLSMPGQVLNKERNFRMEVSQLMNNVNNTDHTLQPDGKQLLALGKVLDHAACALVRIESLRTNHNFAESHKEEYSKEAVTIYYETALNQITDQVDRDLLHLAREAADADSGTMLKQFEASEFVDATKATSRAYVKGLVEEGATKSVATVKSAFVDTPLIFEDAFPSSEVSTVSGELFKESDLGDVYDALVEYVCGQAWAVMQNVPNSEKVVVELQAMLRELVVGSLTYEAVRRRHHERPGLALAVIGLDKVTGNANLKDLYVRLNDQGEIHYVPEFEDGAYVDLMELREYKPVRMHVVSAVKKETEEAGTEQLQTGRKYLYTVGRTNQLFGDMPADVINDCVCGEDGGLKVFPAF